MGAMQAQNYSMVRWAVGMRLQSATIQSVENALKEGEILRTHVMRPTWHLVAAEDIRWMLKLSARRIMSANESFAKGRDIEITEKVYTKCHNLLENILCGKKSLTRQEIAEHFERAGMPADNNQMNRLMARAEQEGIVCSGVDKGKKYTYMLLEERVPLMEARHALYLIESELTAEQWNGKTWYIHQSSRTCAKVSYHLHLLPPFDEYLLGYKDRTDVLPKEHYPKAFTNNGIFYPVILYNGQIVGNWEKAIEKGNVPIGGYSWFQEHICADEALVNQSKEAYRKFLLR